MVRAKELARIAERVKAVEDPELPHVTIGDLGMVRDVSMADGVVSVVLAPTYTGCPATEQIRDDVTAALAADGHDSRIDFTMSPPWSTDWISDEGRRKLAAVGIAPPVAVGDGDLGVLVDLPARCPRCGSRRTRREAEFGATACKSAHVCDSCREPFESFKPR